jgi:hypothetical protein
LFQLIDLFDLQVQCYGINDVGGIQYGSNMCVIIARAGVLALLGNCLIGIFWHSFCPGGIKEMRSSSSWMLMITPSRVDYLPFLLVRIL